MITLLTGVPGSGKTYLAVNRMIEDKKPIHTNIELNDNFPNVHTFFVWDDFYIKLKSLYEFRDEPQMFIDLSKELEVFGISIYFDECHIKLSDQDKIVIWWLSIHRHMSQEIMLITQAKGALAQKYRLYPEIFIDAQRATKRFFSSIMSYYEYCAYRMHKKDDLIRKFSFKTDSKIFDMYRTGEKNKGIATLRKKAYLFIPVILLPILSFAYVLNMFDSDDIPKEENNTTVQTVASFSDVPIPDGQTTDFYIVERYTSYTNINGWLIDNRDKLIMLLMKQMHEKQVISNSYSILKFSSKNKTIQKILSSKELIMLVTKNKSVENNSSDRNALALAL